MVNGKVSTLREIFVPFSEKTAVFRCNSTVADPGFPRGGAPTPRGIERIWTLQGGARPSRPP